MREEFYPMFVSLRERLCLVVGGGAVGERKVRGLLRCRAIVRLVAQELTPWLQVECEEGHITLLGKSYQPEYLEGVDLVFAATDKPALNREIAGEARSRKLWCNMATDPDEGSFIVPSVVRRGDLTVAVSTAGQSPAVAKLIRQKLEEQFGPEWIGYIELLGRLRTNIQSKGLDSAVNQEIFRKVAGLPLAEWIKQNRGDLALEALNEVTGPWLSIEELTQFWNEIWKPFS